MGRGGGANTALVGMSELDYYCSVKGFQDATEKSVDMDHKPNAPVEPLSFIEDCVRKGHILWTYHVNMRMRGRFIPREMILESVDSFEIIEAYPEDKYLPSYLVCGWYGSTVFHVLFAVDVDNGNVRVVTAYRPDPMEWTADWKRRTRR